MAVDPTLFTLPQPQVPLIDPDGNVSRQWFYYFMGIFLRTGGNTPILPAHLQAQINALFVEEAFDDLQASPVPVSFPVFLGEALGDDVPRPAWAFPVLFDQALADDVPRPMPISYPVFMGAALADDPPIPSVNPFLAAFLVSDIA